jgi:urease alpha subunit
MRTPRVPLALSDQHTCLAHRAAPGGPRVRAVHIRALAVAGAIAVVAVSGLSARAQDVLITNATVVDGTGTPARAADVRLVNGKIDAIGEPGTIGGGTRVVDAHGLTLAPGFIDTHSHHDRGIFDHREALAAVSQGVTTIVVGQDGGRTCRCLRSSAGSTRNRER